MKLFRWIWPWIGRAASAAVLFARRVIVRHLDQGHGAACYCRECEFYRRGI